MQAKRTKVSKPPFNQTWPIKVVLNLFFNTWEFALHIKFIDLNPGFFTEDF